jgi:hypothetical protein
VLAFSGAHAGFPNRAPAGRSRESGAHQPTIRKKSMEGKKFVPLPQDILVPPTPATGRRFPLAMCKEKNNIFVLFFLTTRRRRALWGWPR